MLFKKKNHIRQVHASDGIQVICLAISQSKNDVIMLHINAHFLQDRMRDLLRQLDFYLIIRMYVKTLGWYDNCQNEENEQNV